jgi:hypothetical protein
VWINPNHPNPPQQNRAPEERGERLAVFPRGQREELRVSLDTFEGHEFVRLQLWEVGGWPVRGKGCSIRLREVGELAEVLASLVARLDGEARPVEPSRPAPMRQSRGREQVGAATGPSPSGRRDQGQDRPDEGRRPTPQVNVGGQSIRKNFDEFNGSAG